MTVHVRWFDADQQAILLTFQAGWTWADFHAAINTLVYLAQGVPHTVSAVYDARNIGVIPHNLLGHGIRAARVTPLNLDMVILLGASGFVRTITDVFVRAQPEWHGRVLMADTLEEVEALLRARRSADQPPPPPP